MRSLFLPAAALVAASVAASGAAAQPLDAVIEEALRTSPVVLAERETAAAARTDIRAARAAGLPQIGLGATYEIGSGDYDPGPNGQALLAGLPSGPDDSLALAGQSGNGRPTAELAATQTIFTGMQVVNGTRRAKAGAEAASARLEAARQDVAAQVAGAYAGLIAAEARLSAAEAATERFEAEAKAARIRFEAGRITRTDLALAEAGQATGEGQRAAAQAELTAAEALMTALAGFVPEALSAPVLPDLPATPSEAVSAALSASPTLAAARAEARAAQAALHQAKGRRAPQLRARAAAQYAEDQFVTGDELNAVTLTAQLSVPIFEGGAISAAVSRARAQARAAEARLAAARRQVEAETLSAFARHDAALRAREAAGLRAEAASLAAEGAQLERELGRRSLQDALLALQSNADAAAARAEAERSAVATGYALLAVLGRAAPSPGRVAGWEHNETASP